MRTNVTVSLSCVEVIKRFIFFYVFIFKKKQLFWIYINEHRPIRAENVGKVEGGSW